MNKKLFGTLLLGSLLLGGTFVSCKDYDDDIENLQGQISGVESQVTDVKALVAQLQSKLDGMTYVQSVTKSADGKTIKFTMNNGQTVEFQDTDTDTVCDPGSVVTVEDGVLCIDGKPTEIKVASAINMPKVENGQIYIFNEETGEYAATGIFVNQNTVVESATKYTITMTTSDGTTVTYDVPKASGLITEIKVNPYKSGPVNNIILPNPHTHAANIADFEVAQYDVTATEMTNWKGPKPALKNGNIVFGFGKLDVRVNPVTVDLKGIEFSLVNTKNEALPTIALKATAESGWAPIGIGAIGTRANDGNGLWTLSCENKVIARTDWWSTLDTKIGQKVAFAVTAGGDVRSSYNVDVIKIMAPALSKVYFDKGETPVATSPEYATVGSTVPGRTTLVVNKAYTLRAVDEMALYDVYMTVSDLDKETYGIVIDNEARTVKYTKKPDVVTTDLKFTVNIETADNYGKVKEAQIIVNLSSLISTNASFEAQTYDLTKLTDGNPNNNSFAVALDPMKNALGATEYNRWANNVDLTSKNVQYFTDASCADWSAATALNSATAPSIDFVKANGNATTDVNTLKSVKFNVAATNSDLMIGKQYYAKITFKNSATPATELNSIVIPVKFTAPSVSEQFKPKAGYVVDGVINAYFYDVNKKTVDLTKYFDAADEYADLELKGDDNIVTKDANTKWSSNVLAYFEVAAATYGATQTGLNTAAAGNSLFKKTQLNTAHKYLVLTSDKVNGNDATEAGYGKTLTVKVSNFMYSNTSWMYNAWADTQGSFQIKLMSPIFEGTIKPAEGASVKLVANNVSGSNITSEMIVATDYTGTNRIEIMPDAEGTVGAPLAWSNTQIKEMKVSKDDTNTYISALAINPYTAADDTTNPATPEKLGSINVKADPVANDVDTHIYVSVTDAWGYTNKIKLPVTITKQ